MTTAQTRGNGRAALVGASSSSSSLLLDHDSWEYTGGPRKRPRHGLNAAVKGGRGDEGDDSKEESTTMTSSRIVVVGGGGDNGAKEERERNSGGIGSLFFKRRETFPALPDRFSVLGEAMASCAARSGSLTPPLTIYDRCRLVPIAQRRVPDAHAPSAHSFLSPSFTFTDRRRRPRARNQTSPPRTTSRPRETRLRRRGRPTPPSGVGSTSRDSQLRHSRSFFCSYFVSLSAAAPLYTRPPKFTLTNAYLASRYALCSAFLLFASDNEQKNRRRCSISGRTSARRRLPITLQTARPGSSSPIPSPCVTTTVLPRSATRNLSDRPTTRPDTATSAATATATAADRPSWWRYGEDAPSPRRPSSPKGRERGGILFVNSDDADGNEHLSGPEAQDVRLSANMIGKRDGDRILESAARLADAVGNGPPALLGRFVPVGCVDRKSRTLPHIDANCAPVRSADRTFVDGLGYRGRLATTSGGGFSADYVQAEFGGGGVGLDDGRKFRLVSGGGDDFCSGGGGEGNATERRSYLGGGGDGDDSVAVLVDRGGCDFAAKAEAVSRAVAGAGLVILVNRDETEFRMGVNTRSRGRDIGAAAVMVSRGAGRRLEELLNPKIGDDDEDDDSGGLSDVFLTLRGTTERTEATCPDETDAARSCA